MSIDDRLAAIFLGSSASQSARHWKEKEKLNSLKTDIKRRSLRLPLLPQFLHLLGILIGHVLHELRNRLLVNPRIRFVSSVEIRMLGADKYIYLGCLGLAHDPPQWDLPFQLEDLPVLEWFVIFEPGVNGLKGGQAV
jgi:hypothetical protein